MSNAQAQKMLDRLIAQQNYTMAADWFETCPHLTVSPMQHQLLWLNVPEYKARHPTRPAQVSPLRFDIA